MRQQPIFKATTMPNDMVYLKYIDASHNTPLSLKRVRFIINQASNHARQWQRDVLDILDLGCGEGNVSFLLASLGHHITGIDMNPDSISQCTYKNTFPNASFIVGNAESLNEEKRFDVVVCSEVLEHTKSPHLVIQSIDRVLKADGVLILTVPNGYSLSELVISRLLCLGGRSNLIFKALRPIYGFVTSVPTSQSYPFCTASLHLHFFSLRQLRKLFGEYGFVVSAIAHSDLGLPIPGAGRMGRLKGIECRLADFVPHFLAGGWLLAIKRDGKIESASGEFGGNMSKHKPKVVMVSASGADPNVRMDMESEMLAQAGYDVALLGWDKDGTYPRVEKRGNHTLYKIRLKAPRKGGRKIVFFWPIWWCAEFTWLMRRKWDIVHPADLDAFVPALLAARLKRKPIIYDIYDVYADSVPLPAIVRQLVLSVEKFAARLADRLIMTSEGHRHRLGLDSLGKVNLIYNICKYIPSDAKPRQGGKFRIFYAGTLYKSALLNLDKIIMAVGGMKEVELTIAGYGDDYVEELRQLVKGRDIRNVEFMGKTSREDVLMETMNSDLLFVLYDPDLPINAISLPHKLFDALTYGKPILVPKDTVLGRFVTTHDCGVPVNCRSPEDIKAAITRLKNDSEFYNRLALGARKAHEQEYNWQAMSQRLLAVYDEALGKKGARRANS